MSARQTPELAPEGSETPTNPSQAAGEPTAGHDGAAEATANPAARPWTSDTGTTIKMKRACNGCGRRLGDITDQEMARGINGLPLPDVRRECPTCGPTAPEPKCLPTTVVWGDQLCVENECDHEPDDRDMETYCDEVTEQIVCITHSEIDNDGRITRDAAWPCRTLKAVSE